MRRKTAAVLEVVGVFGLTMLLIAAVSVSPLGARERRVTDRFFLEYAVMIVVPLSLIVIGRRSPARCGLSFGNLKYHFDVAITALAPVALAGIPLALVDHRRWDGALLMAGVRIALLFALGRLLRRKPSVDDAGAVVCLAPIALVSYCASGFSPGNAVSAFAFYILFVAFGEELLFRGYIQSRLNAVFGRPFRFFGVPWGWGILAASALFGLMHVLDLGSLVTGNWRPAWWQGVWTACGGLVYGLVREKTGSIVAPTLLHGVPQAIAYAFLGL